MSELPDGWTPTNLNVLFEFKYGKGLVQEKRNPVGSINVFGSNGIVGKHDEALTNGATIIVGRKGSVGEVNFSADKCWAIDTTYYVDDFACDLPPNYWVWYLKSLRLGQQEKSSAIPGLSRDDIYGIEALLPPLNEQRRIVAKLEMLFSRVDAAQARLATIPRILKRFRRSVLAAACSGRLTADWRDIEDGPQELPRSWSNIEFRNLIADGPHNGLYKPQSFYGSGTPIVRIDAFYDGKITNWGKLKRLQVSKNEREQFALADHDILINRVNSPKFLGKSALIQMMPEASVYESNMMRLRLDGSRAIPNYAILYLRSAQGLEELRKNAKHAVNQSSINQQDVRAAAFTLPPLNEQKEIVRRVEALFKTADALEARYRTAKTHVDKLTQSILAKAFRGELVPQDSHDEPASVLLERIRPNKGGSACRT